MITWLKNLFRRKPKGPVIGYRVIAEIDGKKEDMGIYRCSSQEALDKAHMDIMMRIFKSGGRNAVFTNLEAVPVRE